MAHFAKVNDDNIVLDIIRINDEDCGGGSFPEAEKIGQEFISSLGISGRWIQTSYNNSFRKKYAQMGYSYLPDKDVFVEPQPFPSWQLNSDSEWVAPVQKPEDGNHYLWNESDKSWHINEIYHFSDEFINE